MMPYSHKNDLRNRGITGVLLAAKSFLSVARIWRGVLGWAQAGSA